MSVYFVQLSDRIHDFSASGIFLVFARLEIRYDLPKSISNPREKLLKTSQQRICQLLSFSSIPKRFHSSVSLLIIGGGLGGVSLA